MSNKRPSSKLDSNNQNASQKKKRRLNNWYSHLSVLKYSLKKLKQTKEKYANEIQKREKASAKIKNAKCLTKDDYDENNKLINKSKIWSHMIPIWILKMIFKFSVCHPEYCDKTVVNLIQTCKSWRDLIINIDHEKERELFGMLWAGCLYRKTFDFGWKHLVLIPSKYLSVFLGFNAVEQMTKEENHIYRKLCANQEGKTYTKEEIFAVDGNAPLWIQILFHCKNLKSIQLEGRLCEDIFAVLRKYRNNVEDIALRWCHEQESNLKKWFKIVGAGHVKGKSLQNLESLEVRGFNFDLNIFCPYFRNIKRVNMVKTNVDGDSLLTLFRYCTNLESVYIWRYVSENGDWYNAFKMLTKKNKVIVSIEIICAPGFDDDCCRLFMDKNVCPKLKVLVLDYPACSDDVVQELIRKRPDIDDITISGDDTTCFISWKKISDD